ncbi:MAG: DUF2569 domain-containing protein [Proteobacteria bacterium]|nr:DUF2569 domain-containing protein [Pseudomonadota bacterium]
MTDSTATAAAAAAGKKSLQGIKGWLILPAINLSLGVILGIFSQVAAVGQHSEIAAAGYGDIFLVELALDAGLLLLLIYATVLFFSKKRRAPAIIITYFALNFVLANLVVIIEIVFGITDFVLSNMDSVLKNLFMAALWIPYFVISKRVKATFVK